MPHIVRDSQISYRNLFKTMAQGVVYQDAEGQIISANPAAEKILGLTFDQMTGRTSMDPRWKAIHEDGSDFSGETHPAMVALETGERVKDVIMGVFNPGKEDYRWISINAVPEYKEDESKPFQVYTTFNDVTDRKEAEEMLRKSEQRYQTLFNKTPVGVGVGTPDGCALAANEALLKIMGYKEAELNQLNLRDVYNNPEDRGRLLEQFKRDGFVQDFETQFVRKDGTTFYGSIAIISFLIEDENAHLMVMVDITRRKNAEEEREKLINELQQALKEIKTLRGILPLCSFCKKIRDDKGYWERVDVYIHKHLQADISHSICPECAKEHYPDFDINED